MDALIKIFNQLGVDGSIFYQFILFFVLYFVVRSLLFRPLQNVIELREGKTSKLDDEANKKFDKIKELEAEYKTSLDAAYSQAQTIFGSKKEEITKRDTALFKSAETEINTEFENKRKEELAEIESKREAVLKQAQSLSGDLVNKLTN